MHAAGLPGTARGPPTSQVASGSGASSTSALKEAGVNTSTAAGPLKMGWGKSR